MKKKALAAIETHGILLVYPIKGEKNPFSLWEALFPKVKMRWTWDEHSDGRVSELWILREELSRSKKVIYAKWYQGRATFFSIEVFVLLLAYLRSSKPLPRESQTILEALEMDSPLSTKQVKVAAELQGKFFEAAYNRAMKQLWNRLYVLGVGEVADSSFPSLAVGATQNLFEDLWLKSQEISSAQAEKSLKQRFAAENKFWLYAQKIRKGLQGESALEA